MRGWGCAIDSVKGVREAKSERKEEQEKEEEAVIEK